MASKSRLTPAQDKSRFAVNQLAKAFGLSPATVRKYIGQTPPSHAIGRSQYWELSDIAKLTDVRGPYVPQQPKDEPDPETDPELMKPSDRRTHYQAEDLKEAARIKRRRNEIEDGSLIPALEVESVVAGAFKAIALLLDTICDSLERDGIVDASSMPAIIRITDSARDQLATDLAELSPGVITINDDEAWNE